MRVEERAYRYTHPYATEYYPCSCQTCSQILTLLREAVADVELYAKKLEAVVTWCAAGWLKGQGAECKTIGYIPPRPKGHHCLPCWESETRERAKKSLLD